MASASELISNNGNAQLGLVDTAIPVTTNKDLDLINQTGRDIYINNVARNQQLFQRKLQDRDKLLSAIDSGDIRVGDLLEADEPIVKEGLNKLDEAFENRIKKGINDLDAAREYKKALRDAQDRVTQAQGRKVFYDSESGAIGKETLPRKQDARRKNLEGVIKGGFWKDITPYQQTQDLDIQGSILPTAAFTTTETTDPKNPLIKAKKTVFDYDKTLQNNVDNYLNDVNKRYDQQQLINQIQDLPPDKFAEQMTAMNNRITEFNTANGLTPNVKGFVKPIKFDVVHGKGIIAEDVPDFSAKYTLGHEKPFSQTTTELDKAALELEKLKEDKRHNRAGENIDWAKIGVEKSKIDKAKKEDLQGADVVLRTLSNIINKGEQVAGPDIPELNLRSSTGLFRRKAVDNSTFAISDPTLLQQFGKIDKDGKQFDIPNAVQYNKKNGQLNLIYFATDDDGKTIVDEKTGKPTIDNTKTKSLDERTWIAQTTKQLFPNKDIGTINNLVNDALSANDNSLYKVSRKYAGKPETEKQPDLSTDPSDWTQVGDNWRYKDGSVYDAKGNKIK